MQRKLVWGCVLLVVVSLGSQVGLAAEDDPPIAEERGSVEVRFLANEGFLLRTQDISVLIDAFVTKPYSVYGAVPNAAVQEMIAGGAPYHRTRLALVSHIHQDHLEPETAALFMRRRSEVQLWSSPQVVEALRLALPKYDSSWHQRMTAILPEPGETLHRDMQGVHVEFLRLSHGTADIENLGHIIHLNGQRILHIGDAAMDAENFAPYDLASRNLDIALIPYWFFTEAAGEEALEKHLRARYRIAVHIPLKEIDAVVAELQETYPQVHVFTEPLQFQRY